MALHKTITLLVVGCLSTTFAATTTTTADPITTSTTSADISVPTDAPRSQLCHDDVEVKETSIRNKLSALQTTFKPENGNFKRQLDLIFVVDRSKSIGPNAFNQTIATIETLITKFAEQKYIFVHKNFTRVAVISFASQATVDFNGMDNSPTIDACILTERVRGLKTDSFVSNSKIQEALSRARELFAQSRSEPDRQEVTQVIWMFNDGECVEEDDCQPYMEEVRSLRAEQVTIFTAGIGQWLDHESKLTRIKTLATSVDHYACATTWIKIFPRLNGSLGSSVASEIPVYSEIAEVYKPRCGACADGLECACDVINRDYVCTDKPWVPIIEPPVVVVTVLGPSVTATPPAVWLLPVAIGSSVVGGILLLILLITLPLLAARRKRAKEEEKQFFETQPIYGGPLLPPPPRRRNKRIDFSNKDNVYNNPGDNSMYGTGRIHGGEELEDSKDYLVIGYPQDTISDEPKDLDHGMHGWPGHLTSIKQSNRLLHLAIRSVSSGKWAITAGCTLTEKDFRELERVMRNNKYTSHMKIKIANYQYEVDKENLSTSQIHATRFVHKSNTEVFWAFKVYDYVIVGMARQTEDGECARAVYEIHHHLLAMIRADPGNIKGQEDMGESIYSCVLPQRYSRVNEGFDPPV